MLDLVMKGMYGLDVLTKLREMDPAARVIVVSADIQNSSREHGRRRPAPRLPQQAGRARRSCWQRGRRRAGGPTLMELTAVQQDALIELLNIGFGRAAASLSQLTGHRVLLEVPQVTHPPDRRASATRSSGSSRTTSPACTRSSPARSPATRC